MLVIMTGGITPAGGTSYTFGLTAGQCLIIYNRPVVAGVTLDPEVTATVVEAVRTGLSPPWTVVSEQSPTLHARSPSVPNIWRGSRSATIRRWNG